MSSPLSLQTPNHRLNEKIHRAHRHGHGSVRLDPEKFEERLNNADPVRLGLSSDEAETLSGIKGHLKIRQSGTDIPTGLERESKQQDVSQDKPKDLGGL